MGRRWTVSTSETSVDCRVTSGTAVDGLDEWDDSERSVDE